ncbi:MAG TPA: PKD domain-containing protein [Woeseiaceae bacterium]|nr:PKD domain-containing protein [Woeseiaceae bacterium]
MNTADNKSRAAFTGADHKVVQRSWRCVLVAAMLLIAIDGPAAAETYSYDAAGRLATVAFDDGSGIGYEYDKAGNILRISRTPGALPPDGKIDTPESDATIEAGESVDFTSTVADPDGALPLVIRWDFDGAADDSDQEDPGPITFADEGSYDVELHVTDATGLSDPTPARRMPLSGCGPRVRVRIFTSSPVAAPTIMTVSSGSRARSLTSSRPR